MNPRARFRANFSALTEKGLPPEVLDILSHVVVKLCALDETHFDAGCSAAQGMLIAQGGDLETIGRALFEGVGNPIPPKQEEPKTTRQPPPPREPGPPAPPSDEVMAQAIMQQIPGCKTQAQFNAMMAAFDALRIVLHAVFVGNKESEAESRKALDSAIEVARKATEIGDMLRDVPEAASSPAAEEFRQPPAEFHEHDVQRELLRELGDITTTEAMSAWYQTNRERLDKVKSKSLRDVLFDTIRAKRSALAVIGDKPS